MSLDSQHSNINLGTVAHAFNPSTGEDPGGLPGMILACRRSPGSIRDTLKKYDRV